MGPKAKPHEEVLNICLAKILDRFLARRGEDSTRLRYDLDIARALSTASGVAFDKDRTKVRLGALYSEISELV
jgi:hypothetical protein